MNAIDRKSSEFVTGKLWEKRVHDDICVTGDSFITNEMDEDIIEIIEKEKE